MYFCTDAVPPGTSNATTAMDRNLYSTPLFNLGELLDRIYNGSATGLTADPSSVHPLLQHLAPLDLQLCRLMSSVSNRGGGNREAEDLIASLEVPRRGVAQHAADTLRDWLYPDRSGHRPLELEQLRQCIQHAGLVLTLSRLPVADLSQGQRRDIANVLIDLGAHAQTTANLLGLNPASLHRSNPVALCDRLMSEQELRALEDRTATANQRAEAYSRAALVGERFGYPAKQPPLALATAPPACARTQVLRALAGSLIVAPTVPTDENSEVLIAQIAPHDATLCHLMSRQSPARRVSNTAEAHTLIERTAPLRDALAQLTADGLCDWLHADGQLRFAVHPDFLQDRIQSAGLVRVLSLLPVQTLPIAQRRGIGVLLRDVGAHTPTLRAHLQLAEGDLQGIQPIMLRDRLMSLDTLEHLKRGGGGRARASRNQRAEAFQRAKLASERFGYPADYPAWNHLVKRNQDLPRATLLQRLARLSTRQRNGIDLQLP
ncbi:hypothetical protein [Stenotrophomonas sp.]|uniref:hypothetical protein n=1 Tax=Stenotrophomonas sp. TaxID=69392 RepID=UPI002896A516|nr:hypothetical protein [Stenotrophomonas sp.]